jgi:hypothetical protein
MLYWMFHVFNPPKAIIVLYIEKNKKVYYAICAIFVLFDLFSQKLEMTLAKFILCTVL